MPHLNSDLLEFKPQFFCVCDSHFFLLSWCLVAKQVLDIIVCLIAGFCYGNAPLPHFLLSGCSDHNQESSSTSSKVWEVPKPLQRKGKCHLRCQRKSTWLMPSPLRCAPCDDSPSFSDPSGPKASHTQINWLLYTYLCAVSQYPSAIAAATLICFPRLQLCCWKRWMEHLIWH